MWCFARTPSAAPLAHPGTTRIHIYNSPRTSMNKLCLYRYPSDRYPYAWGAGWVNFCLFTSGSHLCNCVYRTAWYPESSCAINANLKEIDRQWIAQELIFYFINIPFRAVQFDNITSKFDSVTSFPHRFAQLGTNCSVH